MSHAFNWLERPPPSVTAILGAVSLTGYLYKVTLFLTIPSMLLFLLSAFLHVVDHAVRIIVRVRLTNALSKYFETNRKQEVQQPPDIFQTSLKPEEERTESKDDVMLTSLLESLLRDKQAEN